MGHTGVATFNGVAGGRSPANIQAVKAGKTNSSMHGLGEVFENELAPWGKRGVGWVIAHDPKMSFLGFYQLILAFGVSQRISNPRNR